MLDLIGFMLMGFILGVITGCALRKLPTTTNQAITVVLKKIRSVDSRPWWSTEGYQKVIGELDKQIKKHKE